jgi:anti-sigma regulatory factor (Ser/Thr protein kinase)
MLFMTVAPVLSELTGVRDALRELAAARSQSEWPMTLVVTELVANAMAASPPDEVIDLRVSCDDNGFDVRVVDRGPGLSTRALAEHLATPPAAGARRGRGLYLVGQITGQLTVDRVDGTTVISAQLGDRPAEASVHPDARGRGRPG